MLLCWNYYQSQSGGLLAVNCLEVVRQVSSSPTQWYKSPPSPSSLFHVSTGLLSYTSTLKVKPQKPKVRFISTDHAHECALIFTHQVVQQQPEGYCYTKKFQTTSIVHINTNSYTPICTCTYTHIMYSSRGPAVYCWWRGGGGGRGGHWGSSRSVPGTNLIVWRRLHVRQGDTISISYP